MQLLGNSLVEVVALRTAPCLTKFWIPMWVPEPCLRGPGRAGHFCSSFSSPFSGSLSLLHFIAPPPLFFPLKNLFQESLAFALSLRP